MNLLCIFDDGNQFPRLISDLQREGAVFCAEMTAATERLSDSGFEGIVLPWRVFMNVRKGPASQRAFFGNLPLLVLLEDAPPESVLAMSLRVIEQGGDDSLVGSQTSATAVIERLQLAKLRREYEDALLCVGQAVPRQATCGLAPGKAQPVARFSTRGWGLKEQSLRVLHLDGDSQTVRQVAQWLEKHASVVIAAGQLAEAKKQLLEGIFDVVLADGDLFEEDRIHALQALQPHAKGAAWVVAGSTPSWHARELALSAGVQDYLDKSQWTGDELWRTLLCSVVRQQRRLSKTRVAADETPQASALYEVPPRERREAPRYILTKPAVVIPILPDRSPDNTLRGDGLTCDISNSGLGFEVAELAHLPGRHLLVGIEGDNEVFYYATVEVCNRQQLEGRLRIGGRFAPPEEDLLRWENLLPTLQPSTYHFQTGLPSETLHKWVQIGVFQPFLADRQLLCPRCHALPTFRRGCRHCGSVHIANHQLIHHFACAHVGFTQDFYQGGEIICPKCRRHNLVVGADFEYLQGPYRCLDCNWSDTELETVGYCLACQWRFALHQAWEEELIGYHVNRLEPLALIGAT